MTSSERAEFDALRNRVTLLEDALGLNYTAPTAWGLTGTESRLVGVLIRSKTATFERLMTALYAHVSDPPDAAILKSYVHRIRLKTPLKIRTIWGLGYSLTPEDRAILAAV